ncbi:MAG: RseA family anti-sigma factor [Betaproteobacteria bacterium]
MSRKVSELLNGQIDIAELQSALNEVAADVVLRDRYTVYQLVGDVLRGNSTPDDGYSLRILDKLREQNAQIEPGYDPLKD